MTTKSSEFSSTSIDSSARFQDWSQRNQNPWQHSNEEIVEFFGHPIDEPDTNNGSAIRYDKEYMKYSDEYEYWKKMSQYNTGAMNLDWVNDPYMTYIINRHLIEGMMDKLELTPSQEAKSYAFFMGLDLGKEGVHAELVAFCVCAVVVNQDDTDRSFHYNQKMENRDSLFVELAGKLSLSESSIQSRYANIEQRLLRGTWELNTSYQRYEKRRLVVPSAE